MDLIFIHPLLVIKDQQIQFIFYLRLTYLGEVLIAIFTFLVFLVVFSGFRLTSFSSSPFSNLLFIVTPIKSSSAAQICQNHLPASSYNSSSSEQLLPLLLHRSKPKASSSSQPQVLEGGKEKNTFMGCVTCCRRLFVS